MEKSDGNRITVSAKILAPEEKTWQLFTDPMHVTGWNFASGDWHAPGAENDLRVGGKFNYRMESKDGSHGFDFAGEYTLVEPHKRIYYTLDDGRKVEVLFEPDSGHTHVEVIFEPDQVFDVQVQKDGWQAIMDNFKKYAERMNGFELLSFEITIDAEVEKVYAAMLDKTHYSEWTVPFSPGSGFIGTWEKGSDMRFFGTDPEGNAGGMISRVRENIPNRFVSLEPVGLINNGEEITSGPEVEGWAGTLENYTFTSVGGKTLLRVDMHVSNEWKEFTADAWPKALKILKDICER
jgi:uncharacterized protein YndB with AHSA1/START domain